MDQKYVRQAMRDIRRRDDKMRTVIERVGPVSVSLQGDMFTKLARSIVGQQLSGKAASSIWGKIANKLGDGDRFAPESAARARVATLRACGLSSSKAAYLKNLSRYVLETEHTNQTFKKLSNEKVVDELTQIKGIGRWTVEMYLMFGLGRKDVLPVDDLGIRKGFIKVYRLRNLPSAKKMHSLAKNWNGHLTIGSMYLWRSLEI